MGTNCAPYLANLFLYAYESEFIDKLMVDNPNAAKQFTHVHRYQDDCISFNDGNLFETKWREIYPPEMILEKTSLDNHCTILDLEIAIVNNRFSFKSFDKRNNFPFDIVNYPDLFGNIPQNPSYGVYHSQLVRFCDLNGSIENFKRDVITLTSKFENKNFESKKLGVRFKRFCNENIVRWSKFGIDIINFL